MFVFTLKHRLSGFTAFGNVGTCEGPFDNLCKVFFTFTTKILGIFSPNLYAFKTFVCMLLS